MGLAFRAKQLGIDARLLPTSLRGPTTIRGRLAAMVLAAVVPLIALLVVTIVNVANASRKAQVDALLYTTQTAVVALDAHLRHYINVAEFLAKSPSLLRDDLTTFRTEAERAFPEASEATLIVSDPEGQQLLNLLLPPDAPLPRHPDTSLAAQARAFSTKSLIFSDVYRGRIRGEWVVDIEVPLFRDGRPYRSLTVTLTTRSIFRLLSSQKIPSGWLAGIIDSSGRFVARIPANDAMVGQPASRSWREVMHREGIFEFGTLEGHTTVGANLISEISRWPVAVSARTSVLNAPVWDATKWAALGTIAISLLSVLLAVAIARRISTPIVELEKQATALVGGQAAHLDSGLPEIAHAWVTLKEAVAERKRAEDHQQFLMRELAHRLKNQLAVIQAMAGQTARRADSLEDFQKQFAQRVQGLAVSTDLLVAGGWTGTRLVELVEHQLRPFDPGSERLICSGPRVSISIDATQAISMALYELATNSAKHGAWSVAAGTVTASWQIDAEGAGGPYLRLMWVERGGPPVVPPKRRGFGHTVIETMAAHKVGGEARLIFAPEGLSWTLTVPAAHFNAGDAERGGRNDHWSRSIGPAIDR